MNSKKVLIKAVILTALMQSVEAQRRQLTETELVFINKLNDELDELGASGEPILAQGIDETFADLLAVVDTIPEAL
jgi:hypothetical protein